MSSTWTAIIMAVFFVAFIGVDLWLNAHKNDTTYSAFLRHLGKVWPPVRLLIAFGMGLLAGHWWWTSTVGC